MDILLPRYIKVPSGDQLQNISDGFTTSWDFLSVDGVVHLLDDVEELSSGAGGLTTALLFITRGLSNK